MKFCPRCGFEIDDGTKFCTECGAPLTYNNVGTSYIMPEIVQKKHSGLGITAFVFSLTLVLSVIGVILAIIDLSKNRNNKHGLSIAALIIGGVITAAVISQLPSQSAKSSDSSSQTKVVEKQDNKTTIVPATETKEEYINSCTEVIYKNVAREPDTYKGKRLKISGKVLQVVENSTSTTLRIGTSSNGYDDVWYVTYIRAADEKRILEDDKVEIFGECTGLHSYYSVFGSKITLPSLSAKYVDIAELSLTDYSVSIERFEINKSRYDDGYKYSAIVEIRNSGKNNLYLKDVKFDIEDADGHLVQTNDYMVSAFPDVIKPNETGYLYTPYEITLDGVTEIEGLTLVPQFTAVITYATPYEYAVSDVSIIDGKYGIKATGRVANNTTEDNSYLNVYILYYDVNGKILGIDDTVVTGLDAGKTVSFEADSFIQRDDFSAADVADYKIVARDSYYEF